MPDTLLNLKDLHKTYASKSGPVTVLAGTNLTIQAGETVAIIGQSGAGKSTLLHVAGLLDQPDSGTVTVVGQSTEAMRDRAKAHLRNKTFGFIYQHHHLLREFTALENVLMPARIAGTPLKEGKVRAAELLAQVGLTERLHHLPGQLSGGERQRVAIARALMTQPKLLLADEPTGNLDPQTAAEVEGIFQKMVTDHQMALLLVTHNPELAARCQRVYRMVGGHLETA